MRKRLMALFLAVLLCMGTFPTAVIATDGTVSPNRGYTHSSAVGTPEIDGIADDIWSTVSAAIIDCPSDGENNSTASAQVKILNDDKYLYFLAEITDDSVAADNVFELYLDEDNCHTQGYCDVATQLCFNLDGKVSAGFYSVGTADMCTHKFLQDGNKYTFEGRISLLGGMPTDETDTKIGVEFAYFDYAQTDFDEFSEFLFWNYDGTSGATFPYASVENHGELTLVYEPHTHVMTYHAAVAAGCHTTGMTEYWVCDDCGAVYLDAEGTKAGQPSEIPATGTSHREGYIAATMTTEGSTGTLMCECGVVLEEARSIPAKQNAGLGKSYTANYGTPVIDGVMDDIWSMVSGGWTVINVPFKDESAQSVCSARAKVLHDDTNIYVLAEITDATYNGSKDAFEVYLDEDNCKEGAYCGKTSQLQFCLDQTVKIENDSSVGGADMVTEHKVVTTENGWILEIAIKPLYGIPAATGDGMGLEFSYFDADENGNLADALYWNTDRGNGQDLPFMTNSHFGNLFFAEGIQPDVPAVTIAIDETNFPDANFRAYVLETIDENSDGALSAEEVLYVGFMDISSKEISDLTGISYFTSLEHLECSWNPELTVDLTMMPKLRILSAHGTNITTLDLSTHPRLESLGLSDTELTEIDVSMLSALVDLNIDYTAIKTIDVSNNANLVSLHISNTAIDTLNLTGCPKLEELYCYNSNVSELDVSVCPALRVLWAGETKIDSINVSGNAALTELRLDWTKVQTVDLTKNPKLQYFGAIGCQLTALDLSANTALTKLEIDGNTYAITVGEQNKFDLTALPQGFDVAKTLNWVGGTVKDNILTVDRSCKLVTYDYATGNSNFPYVTFQLTTDLEAQNRGLSYTAGVGTPVIDGALDDIWSKVEWTKVDLPYTNDTPDSECSAQVKVLQDTSYLYFLAEISDATVAAGNGDAFEIYLDEDNCNAATYCEKATHLQLHLDGTITRGVNSNGDTDMVKEYEVAFVDGHYILECKIAPLGFLTAGEESPVGLEFMYGDYAADGMFLNAYRWNVDTANGQTPPYLALDNFGTLYLTKNIYPAKNELYVPRLTATVDGVIAGDEWLSDTYISLDAGNSVSWTEGKEIEGATYHVSWDEAGLYIAAEVTDDNFVPATSKDEIFTRDSVQFAIDPNGMRAASGAAGGMMYTVMPLEDGTLYAVYQPKGNTEYQDFTYIGEYSLMKDEGGMQIVWQFEIMIPWASMKTEWQEAGSALAGNYLDMLFCILDCDKDESYVEHFYMLTNTGSAQFEPISYPIRMNLVQRTGRGLEYTAKEGTPVIDNAHNDECWSDDAWTNVDLPYANGSSSDATMRVQVVNDREYLYFLAEVDDPTHVPNNGDAIELYLDEDNCHGSKYCAYATQLIIRIDGDSGVLKGEVIQGTNSSNGAEMVKDVKVTKSNGLYYVECAIKPLKAFNANNQMGLEFMYRDSDVDGNFQNALRWNADTANGCTPPYQSTEAFGTLNYFYDANRCGDGVKWAFEESTGTLTFTYTGSGTGAMDDYFFPDATVWGTNAPWYSFSNEIKAVVVGKGVTTIGDMAFLGTHLETVTLPSTLKSIGNNAFCESGLTEITIPASVELIENGALNAYNLVKLHFTTLPVMEVNAINIKSGAIVTFADNVNVTLTNGYWTAPNGVVYRTDKAEPNAILEGKLNDSITWKLDMASDMLAIQGTGAMPVMTDYPWEGLLDAVTSIAVGEGITAISTNAFRNMPNLTTVVLPTTLTSVGDLVFFYDENLTEIHFNGGAPTAWGRDVCDGSSENLIFYFNDEVTGFDSDEMTWTAPSGDIYPATVSRDCGEGLIWNFDEETGKLTIETKSEDPVALFSLMAFGGMELADEAPQVGTMKQYEAVLDENGKVVSTTAPWAKYADKITSVSVEDGVTSVGSNAFAGLNATSVTLHESVTAIESGAFRDSALTSVTIPESVTTLGESAFNGCKDLEKVELNSIPEIEAGALANLSKAVKVTLSDTAKEEVAKETTSTNLKSGYLVTPDNVVIATADKAETLDMGNWAIDTTSGELTIKDKNAVSDEWSNIEVKSIVVDESIATNENTTIFKADASPDITYALSDTENKNGSIIAVESDTEITYYYCDTAEGFAKKGINRAQILYVLPKAK